jgi:hypothetical protein
MKLHDMRFKVEEGIAREGVKFVKTTSERNEHQVVQREEESVEDEWNRVELAQSTDAVLTVLKVMLDNYKGPAI